MTSSVNRNTPKRRCSDVKSSLFLLLGLIEAREWAKFEAAALSNPCDFRSISEAISECDCFHGTTLLHACVRFDAPLAILNRMIELYPRALPGRDSMGRTPLHVAVWSSARPRIVKRLVGAHSQACAIPDEDGMTPLHFTILLAGSLDEVVLEDVDEMNPTEYALLSDASMGVIHLLQRASLRVLQKRKKTRVATYPMSMTRTNTSIPMMQLAH
ncbi:hypothetical protein ACHAWF_004274 [Thalassiosira exigua]